MDNTKNRHSSLTHLMKFLFSLGYNYNGIIPAISQILALVVSTLKIFYCIFTKLLQSFISKFLRRRNYTIPTKKASFFSFKKKIN